MTSELDRRGAYYIRRVVENVKIEMTAHTLPVGRPEVVCVLTRPSMIQQAEWINQRLRLRGYDEKEVTPWDVLCFRA